jgi:MFS family permease
LALLFLSRLGAGVAGATIATAQAVIADSTPPERRSRGMALVGAAFGIGFTFGPLLGFVALLLMPDFTAGPGFLAAGLSLVAFGIGAAILPETLRPELARAGRRWLDWRGFQAAWRAPRVGTLIFIFFLATFAFAMFEPTLALLTREGQLGLNDRNNFLVFAYVGLVLSFSQGLLYRRLALWVRELSFMTAGAGLMALGLAGLGWVALAAGQPGAVGPATVLTMLLVFLAVAVTGFSFLTPSVQALISRLSDPAKQGEVLGVNQSASAMARIVGPAVGVPLFYLSPSHLLPYGLGAGLLLIVLLLTVCLRQGTEDRSG